MLDQCWRHVALEMRLCNLVELIEIAVAGIETGDDGMIYGECSISNAGLFLVLICASDFSAGISSQRVRMACSIDGAIDAGGTPVW